MDDRERARKGKMKEVLGEDASSPNGKWNFIFGRKFLMSAGRSAKDWVIQQTLDRVRRELEADEQEYEARLAQARKREEVMRRAAKGRVTKRLVCYFASRAPEVH